MSAYRRASVDTWSDLSSDTTNGTADYSYTTDPAWAADAVILTDTGIELNFERLNALCMSESLPTKISVDVITPSSLSSRHGRFTGLMRLVSVSFWRLTVFTVKNGSILQSFPQFVQFLQQDAASFICMPSLVWYRVSGVCCTM